MRHKRSKDLHHENPKGEFIEASSQNNGKLIASVSEYFFHLPIPATSKCVPRIPRVPL